MSPASSLPYAGNGRRPRRGWWWSLLLSSSSSPSLLSIPLLCTALLLFQMRLSVTTAFTTTSSVQHQLLPTTRMYGVPTWSARHVAGHESVWKCQATRPSVYIVSSPSLSTTTVPLPSLHHRRHHRHRYSTAVWMRRCATTTTTTPRHHHRHHHYHHHDVVATTTTTTRLSMVTPPGAGGGGGNVSNKLLGIFAKAVAKFKARPGTYLFIPCVAAFVGWFTNWLAVQMIFYPIRFRGLPIYQPPEMPLGVLGWQGIVPCKTRPMTEAMVDMVTTQLMSVRETFGRLKPRVVGKLLAPEIPQMTRDILGDIVPHTWIGKLPNVLGTTMENRAIRYFNFHFVTRLCQQLQANIEHVFDIKACVVNQMLQDRAKLGQLFRRCGHKELDFLVNSGVWFGFLLGIIQMIVALFWENPWSLSIGGGIVGLATNWLALKWIFEPVNPTKIGPFILQGQFLRRQKEVSAEFSKVFATKVLSAEGLWRSMLTDPQNKPAFAALFATHFNNFAGGLARLFGIGLDVATVQRATDKAMERLPRHVPVLYNYMDETLNLEETLRIRMEEMSSSQFERVLHPIFEEDELTLILAGAALGFAAGLVQQGVETGAIVLPNLWKPFQRNMILLVRQPGTQLGVYAVGVKSFGGSAIRQTQATASAISKPLVNNARLLRQQPRKQLRVYGINTKAFARSMPSRIRSAVSRPFKNPNGYDASATKGADDSQDDQGTSNPDASDTTEQQNQKDGDESSRDDDNETPEKV